MQTVVILDVETTGLSKNYEAMTEFSALKMHISDKGFVELGKFSTLIHPGKSIPRFITKLTGITNEMVKDAPKPKQIAPQIKEFIGDATVIAHNATFDCGFLNMLFSKADIEPLQNEVICTRFLSRRIVPGLDSYSLKNLCEHFEIEQKQSHRAESDVQVTKQLFESLLAEMQNKGLKIEHVVRK